MNEEEGIVHATGSLLESRTVHYIIDPKGSAFFVQAFASGLLSAFAHNPKLAVRDFAGEASFVRSGATLGNVRVQLTIQADSLEVVDDISKKDRDEIHMRMANEVFETEQFPEIVYECSRVSANGNADQFWAMLNGELTLHGVTRTLPISARVTLNGNSLRASGEFSVRQSDFGIQLISAAGGAIRVKDDVKCSFDFVAHLRE